MVGGEAGWTLGPPAAVRFTQPACCSSRNGQLLSLAVQPTTWPSQTPLAMQKKNRGLHVVLRRYATSVCTSHTARSATWPQDQRPCHMSSMAQAFPCKASVLSFAGLAGPRVSSGHAVHSGGADPSLPGRAEEDVRDARHHCGGARAPGRGPGEPLRRAAGAAWPRKHCSIVSVVGSMCWAR